MQKTDVIAIVIVVGGGLVGLSIAYGLAMLGRQVSVLDEGDDAFRAARGNFGLLWVQGKGYGMSPYAQWTRESVVLWPRFAASLQADTGIDIHLRQPGGFQLGLSDDEMAEESRRLPDARGHDNQWSPGQHHWPASLGTGAAGSDLGCAAGAEHRRFARL